MSQFAFVFPGQGSQSVGMLATLAKSFPIIQETFAEAAHSLNYDLWQLVSNGPIETLNKTWKTQPALLTASVALYRLWQQQQGPAAHFLAGHSLGEYSALVCAGSLNFAEAVTLVELRGKLMQAAVPDGVGAMQAIIGLDAAAVQIACSQSAGSEIVAPVNFNSPKQIVIAGHKAAVERAGIACKAAGAKRALPLPISVPSHCNLMRPAADKLAEALKAVKFEIPVIPVINNVDVVSAATPEAIRDALVRQLYSPVRWTETVQFLASQGVTRLIEMGPGNVLTGLAKRIDETLDVTVVNDLTSLNVALGKK